MLTLLRHLAAIAILPYMVAVQIPIWIARRTGVVPALGSSSAALAVQAAGVAVIAVGLLLSLPRLLPARPSLPAAALAVELRLP